MNLRLRVNDSFETPSSCRRSGAPNALCAGIGEANERSELEGSVGELPGADEGVPPHPARLIESERLDLTVESALVRTQDEEHSHLLVVAVEGQPMTTADDAGRQPNDLVELRVIQFPDDDPSDCAGLLQLGFDTRDRPTSHTQTT